VTPVVRRFDAWCVTVSVVGFLCLRRCCCGFNQERVMKGWVPFITTHILTLIIDSYRSLLLFIYILYYTFRKTRSFPHFSTHTFFSSFAKVSKQYIFLPFGVIRQDKGHARLGTTPRNFKHLRRQFTYSFPHHYTTTIMVKVAGKRRRRGKTSEGEAQKNSTILGLSLKRTATAISRVAPRVMGMFNKRSGSVSTNTTPTSPDPTLLVNFSDDRRKFVFELTTDKKDLSWNFSARNTFVDTAAAADGDIVDCSIKQRTNRAIHAKKKGFHNSIWDCWLVVKKGDRFVSLTAVDFFHASNASPKQTVQAILAAQNTYLRPKYVRRQRKGNDFLKRNEERYENVPDIVFKIFFESDFQGQFAICAYVGNQEVLIRQEYRIVTSCCSKTVLDLSALAIETLRRSPKTFALRTYTSLQKKEDDVLSPKILQSFATYRDPTNTLENFHSKWEAGAYFYIVSLGSGSCRDCLLNYRSLRKMFGTRLRLKCLLVDMRFRSKPGTNKYSSTLHTLDATTIACNDMTNCFEEMLAEEKEAGYSIFHFFTLDYTEQYFFALYKLRGRTLLFMAGPNCSPFSKSNFGALPSEVRQGVLGVYYVFSLIAACSPLFWVVESTGSTNPRLLMHQPLMKPLEHLREEYTHCMFESPPIKLDSNGAPVLWLFKPTHVWSSAPLHLRTCEKAERCLCFRTFHKHKPVESLTSREEKAMWPLGFIEAICNAVKELLKK